MPRALTHRRFELTEIDWENTIENWRTREGFELPIAEMTDEHLHNAIRYFWAAAPEAVMRKAFRPQLLGAIIAPEQHVGDISYEARVTQENVYYFLANDKKFFSLVLEAFGRKLLTEEDFNCFASRRPEYKSAFDVWLKEQSLYKARRISKTRAASRRKRAAVKRRVKARTKRAYTKRK